MPDNTYLDLNLANNLKISIYNHTRVTTSAIAPKYSIYFGAPASADCSMISKSSTRFRAAIATMQVHLYKGLNTIAIATMKIDKKIDALLLLLKIAGVFPTIKL